VTLRLLPLFGDFTSSRDVKERLMVIVVRCRTDARKYCNTCWGNAKTALPYSGWSQRGAGDLVFYLVKSLCRRATRISGHANSALALG
jgi:hypothetical protein